MANLFSKPIQQLTKCSSQDSNHNITEPANPLQISKKLLTPRDIEEIFGVKKSTVEQWRLRGCGPKFLRLTGSRLIRYRRQDVLDFISAQIAVNSTAEADALGGHRG